MDIGQVEGMEEQAAVRVRIGAHAPHAGGSELGDFRPKCALCREELVDPIATQPVLEDLRGGRACRSPLPAPGGPATYLPRVRHQRIWGPSSPWVKRRTNIGERGRSRTSLVPCADAGSRRQLSSTTRQWLFAMRGCISIRFGAIDEERPRSRSHGEGLIQFVVADAGPATLG